MRNQVLCEALWEKGEVQLEEQLNTLKKQVLRLDKNSTYDEALEVINLAAQVAGGIASQKDLKT